jgi:hypothetical protein
LPDFFYKKGALIRKRPFFISQEVRMI